MAKKSMGSDPGRGKPMGRFKNADRGASSGAKSPGQKAKMPRGKMKVGAQPKRGK
jgi:hypothetical protein